MRYSLSEIRNAKDGWRDEGTYHVEVLEAEDQVAKTSGSRMIRLILVEPDTDGQVVCYDRLMIEGGGMGITKKKLQALGINLDAADFDSQDLIGRRFHVAVKFGKPNDQGKRFLEVDIAAKGSKCGYWSEAEPPPPRVVDGDPSTWPKDDAPFDGPF